jgi:acyl-CoA synthetase (AMP-forming)/AMP-acid ligase II/thioesterase domain-containing protein
LAACGAARGEAAALLAPGRSILTYSKLIAQVDNCTAILQSYRLRPTSRVAAVLPNGPDMVVGFLATTAVAAFAPLNPAYRAAEFAFYLDDLQADLLIMLAGVDSPCREVASARGIPVLDLQPLVGSSVNDAPMEAALVQDCLTEATDTALVLHTSGTTARPKMVALDHNNLIASATQIASWLALTPHDRCLNVMPLFHIHGLVGATLATLLSGGSLVCVPGFHAFYDWLEAFEPTWFTAVPTIHQAILGMARDARRPLPSSLRFIRSSSAPLPPQVMNELELLFGVPVLEAYGMTEAAHQMASNPLPPRRRKPGSVGVPVGTRIEVIDDEGHPLEPGRTGEIVVQGDNVIKSYFSNAEANASSFIGSWFRTGDEGYFDEDGYLFINGRTKEIINRGGEKVSPREVEEVLLEHPAVAEAVVFAMRDRWLGEEVAAAVVPRAGRRLDEADLCGFAAKRLADFKLPRRIVFLSELAKGPTGKLQRIGLADRLGILQQSDEQARIAGGKPRHRFEYWLEWLHPRLNSMLSSIRWWRQPQDASELVADAWRQVLDERSLSADKPFDEAGGDSLQLLKLIFLIEEAQAVKLPMDACHVGLRPSALVRIVEAAMQPRARPPTEPVGTVFMIPGLSGDTPLEGGFRASCAPSLRVTVVDLPDWPDMVEPGFTMEHIIERAAAEIATRAPTGPVRLVGYSLGGHIAFGAAQLLTEMGREVAFLGILDTSNAPRPNVVPRGTPPIRFLRLIRWEIHNFLRFARLGMAMDWAGQVAAKLLAHPGKRWRLRVAAGIRHIPLPSNFAMFVNIYMGELLRTRLLNSWQAGCVRRHWLTVPVVLFCSEEHTEDVPTDLGWRLMCPNLRVVKVRGVHATMLRPPYVRELSACFIDEANRALERLSDSLSDR